MTNTMGDSTIKHSDPAVLEGYENEAYSGSENDVRNGNNTDVVVAKQSHDKVIQDKHSSQSEEDSQALLCGLGSCKPNCLQVFNNPKAVLACLCFFAFTQG